MADRSDRREHGKSGSEIEQDQTRESPDQDVSNRDQDVINDEKEAMRRANLPKPGDDAAEAEDPKIAEIESVLAATRH